VNRRSRRFDLRSGPNNYDPNAMNLFNLGMSGNLDAYRTTFSAALRAIILVILGFIVEGTT
jgi:hypothetical protein